MSDKKEDKQCLTCGEITDTNQRGECFDCYQERTGDYGDDE